MALASAALLGMGDAGVSNVIYTTIPIVWGNKSLSAFGLFKDFFKPDGPVRITLVTVIVNH